MARSQFSPPTHFNSSPLVRLLASLDIAPVAHSTQTFAEKLSDWVAWTDAIALSGVLADAPPSQAPAALTAPSAGARRVIAHVARVRKDLADAIDQDALLRDDGAQAGKPVDGDGSAETGDKVDYSAYRRQYRAHQHTMEDHIGRLRAGVRTALSGLSPALRQLAALDAALDVALAPHQRQQLEKVPLMLEKRFQAMHKSRQATPAQEADLITPAPRRPPLAIGQTLQRVLLAELEVRLQPIQGLVDALGREAAQPA